MIKRLSFLLLCMAGICMVLYGCAGIGSDTLNRDQTVYAASLEPEVAQVQPPKPQQREKHYQAARAALMEGNMDKANLEVKLALQENPLDAASHFLLGCLLEKKGEHGQAIVAFQRVVALDPNNSDALYNLGTMLLWQRELIPASRLLENAVLINPDYVPSYNNLAKAYFLAGLPELAVASYEEVLRQNPSNAIALNNLLLLAEATGNQDAAANYRQRLKALGSDYIAKPANDKGEPITLLPTRPVTTVTGESDSTNQLPVTPVPKIQPLTDKEADALREVLCDLPHVTVERRAGRLTLTGYISNLKERSILDRIIGKSSEILDLTSDDTGDPQRMIEFDAILFIMTGLDQQDVGFNFLKLINTNFNYFVSDNKNTGTGYAMPPAVTGPVTGLSQSGWIFSAAASYSVNIANAANERVAVLARPHLTALSGTSANFLAGGELIFKVAGNISGDIKPYPFGTSLKITPTLLRTTAEDGTPRVHVKVEAGRISILSILDQDPELPTSFSKVTVSSEAVISLGQTLVLSGLSQRESRTGRSGVPFLRDIPILKYLFSTKTTVNSDAAVIILLTPRDPAFSDEKNQKALDEFVQMRRAFIHARRGTDEDMKRFRERYPDWQQTIPNRFASHFFMLENSPFYRVVSGQNLTSEDVNLDLLGPKAD